MPRFRDRYTGAEPRRLAARPFRTPKEFMAGVGRLGHGLVREIYALNDAMQVAGLRNLVRHTSTGRPHDMPLTEDWLVDFSKVLRHRSLGPAEGSGLGAACRAPLRHRVGTGPMDPPMVSSCAILLRVRGVGCAR